MFWFDVPSRGGQKRIAVCFYFVVFLLVEIPRHGTPIPLLTLVVIIIKSQLTNTFFTADVSHMWLACIHLF